MSKKDEMEQNSSYDDYLKWYQTTDVKTYEKPSLAVDNVMFSVNDVNALQVLLIKRKAHPYKDQWALPGGFVSPDESTDDTCLRETEEETGVKLDKTHIEQLYTFSAPGRDPRAWIVSTAYMTFLPEQPDLAASDDAKEAVWAQVIRMVNGDVVLTTDTEHISSEELAFDHHDILLTALTRIEGKLDYEPNILRVMAPTFTLTDVRILFQQINPGKPLSDNSNLLRTHGKFFEEAGETVQRMGRPAKLYRLKD